MNVLSDGIKRFLIESLTFVIFFAVIGLFIAGPIFLIYKYEMKELNKLYYGRVDIVSVYRNLENDKYVVSYKKGDEILDYDFSQYRNLSGKIKYRIFDDVKDENDMYMLIKKKGDSDIDVSIHIHSVKDISFSGVEKK